MELGRRFVVRRVRSSGSKSKPAQTADSLVQLLPEDAAEVVADLGRRLSEAVDEGMWRTWAGTAAALWVLFRLAELRQLRRMNAALLGRR